MTHVDGNAPTRTNAMDVERRKGVHRVMQQSEGAVEGAVEGAERESEKGMGGKESCQEVTEESRRSRNHPGERCKLEKHGKSCVSRES